MSFTSSCSIEEERNAVRRLQSKSHRSRGFLSRCQPDTDALMHDLIYPSMTTWTFVYKPPAILCHEQTEPRLFRMLFVFVIPSSARLINTLNWSRSRRAEPGSKELSRFSEDKFSRSVEKLKNKFDDQEPKKESRRPWARDIGTMGLIKCWKSSCKSTVISSRGTRANNLLKWISRPQRPANRFLEKAG